MSSNLKIFAETDLYCL